MLILIVEDEAEIARLIRLYLEKEGFTCEVCGDGETALQYQAALQPDLIVLDVMLPRLDGLEVCTRIRQKPGDKDPYILMLTARGEEIDRIIGLSTGADDYLVKPFSPRELVARVRALLRRSLRHSQTAATQGYQTTHFWVDLEQRICLSAGFLRRSHQPGPDALRVRPAGHLYELPGAGLEPPAPD